LPWLDPISEGGCYPLGILVLKIGEWRYVSVIS